MHKTLLALMIAAAAGFEEMVELLLSPGADLSIVDSGGKSPLERAVECHRSGVADILKKTSPSRKASFAGRKWHEWVYPRL